MIRMGVACARTYERSTCSKSTRMLYIKEANCLKKVSKIERLCKEKKKQWLAKRGSRLAKNGRNPWEFFLGGGSSLEPAEQQTAAAFSLLFSKKLHSASLHFIHASTNAIFVNCLEKDAHDQKNV